MEALRWCISDWQSGETFFLAPITTCNLRLSCFLLTRRDLLEMWQLQKWTCLGWRSPLDFLHLWTRFTKHISTGLERGHHCRPGLPGHSCSCNAASFGPPWASQGPGASHNGHEAAEFCAFRSGCRTFRVDGQQEHWTAFGHPICVCISDHYKDASLQSQRGVRNSYGAIQHLSPKWRVCVRNCHQGECATRYKRCIRKQFFQCESCYVVPFRCGFLYFGPNPSPCDAYMSSVFQIRD